MDAKISLMLQEDGIKKPFKWVNKLVLCYQEEDLTVPVIPLALIEKILHFTHDQGGHFGVEKSIKQVKRLGWWESITEGVTNWVRCCEGCQTYKVRNDNRKPPMKPITPTRIGQI